MVKTTGAKPTKAETKANNKKKGANGAGSSHNKAAARQFENDQAELKKERAEKKETQLAQAKEKDAMEAKKTNFLKQRRWQIIPEDMDERVLKSLELMKAAEEEGIKLAKTEVQAHCGIGKKKLDNAIKNKEEGGDGLVPMGRPTRMTEEQAERVNDILFARGISWNAVMVDDGDRGTAFVDVCMEVLREDMVNKLCDVVPPSRGTIEIWRQQCGGVDRSGSKKNDGRMRALINI
jgi:hypothetical protein